MEKIMDKIKVGQHYKIVNYIALNGIKVKVVKINLFHNYLCEIVDKSLLNDSRIQIHFYSSIYGNSWYIWLFEDNLQPLRSDKLKRLLK